MSDDKLREATRILFEELAARGVAIVEISYDGEGDNGQIVDLCATDAEGNVISLEPEVSLSLWKDAKPILRPLEEAVDGFAWELLAAYHDGFENNEGGFGTITLDVARGKAVIDHNDRIIDLVNTVTEV